MSFVCPAGENHSSPEVPFILGMACLLWFGFHTPVLKEYLSICAQLIDTGDGEMFSLVL